MPDLPIQIYIIALFSVLIAAIFGYVLVLFSLRNSELRIPSYRLFFAYFVIAGIGWVFRALNDSGLLLLELKGSFTIYLVCSALIYLAVSEYSSRFWLLCAVITVHGVLIVFSLMSVPMSIKFFVLIVYSLILYSHLVYLALSKAKARDNLGYFIISVAGLLVVLISPLNLYALLVLNNIHYVYCGFLVATSVNFVLIGIGLLTAILIIENQQLKALAMTDPLTGVLNRRGLEIAALSSFTQAKRNHSYMSAIAIDIDHFKRVNDQYGHDCGDSVLKSVARVLTSLSRASDICCRAGGEEFVIILPNTAQNVAVIIAERIRLALEALTISFSQNTIVFTASFGVASHCEKLDLDALLKSADKALYAAKTQGRNQVCTVRECG